MYAVYVYVCICACRCVWVATKIDQMCLSLGIPNKSCVVISDFFMGVFSTNLSLGAPKHQTMVPVVVTHQVRWGWINKSAKLGVFTSLYHQFAANISTPHGHGWIHDPWGTSVGSLQFRRRSPGPAGPSGPASLHFGRNAGPW